MLLMCGAHMDLSSILGCNCSDCFWRVVEVRAIVAAKEVDVEKGNGMAVMRE